MLAHEMAGRTYSKAGHRRRLAPRLANRSKGAIERKHQNISAVLQALGMTRINGYRPARNYQQALVEAVGRWFARNPVLPEPAWQTGLDIPDRLEPGPPPARRNREPPTQEGMLGLAHTIDMAGRDERNRALGRGRSWRSRMSAPCSAMRAATISRTGYAGCRSWTGTVPATTSRASNPTAGTVFSR